ncbi:MAG TPA: hypothetical protein VHA37_05660 [Candidatus Saccharimonadales bacterium]|nr:hypothetical protein [Candidatus Saccharimonadales bacterium]
MKQCSLTDMWGSRSKPTTRSQKAAAQPTPKPKLAFDFSDPSSWSGGADLDETDRPSSPKPPPTAPGPKLRARTPPRTQPKAAGPRDRSPRGTVADPRP